MAKRKEITRRVVLEGGRAVTIRVLDGLLIDDILVQGMKAEGFRVMTGNDASSTTPRKIRDYLIRTGVILD